MSGNPGMNERLEALETELRRGNVSLESLRSYLDLDLPAHVRIELEWMLYAIKQLEEHRERLVTRLSELHH
jgi:hypothetical protein